MKNMNIISILLTSLVKSVESDRVQELILSKCNGEDALRVAMYLNGTLDKVTPETLTPGDVSKMAKLNNNIKNYWESVSEVKVVSVDNINNTVDYQWKGMKKYWFKSKEAADNYSKTGETPYGQSSYFDNKGYDFMAIHESTENGSTSIETWENVMAN